jgi:hypothetical protein
MTRKLLEQVLASWEESWGEKSLAKLADEIRSELARPESTDMTLMRACYEEQKKLAQQECKPDAWMWQHDETGRTGFIEAHLSHGWKRMNPRLKLVRPAYFHPPVQQERKPCHTEAEVQELLAEASKYKIDLIDDTEAVIRRILGVPAPKESDHG